MDSIRQYLADYIASFTIYDYVAYSWLIVLFCILIILSLMMIKRSIFITLFLIFFSFFVLFFSPIGIKYVLDSHIRKNRIEVQNKRYLHFAKALVVSGKITNTSNLDYAKCRVYVNILKKSSNKYLKYINRLNPLVEKSIVVNKEIKKDEDCDFRVVLDNFNYKDYNVSVKADCY